MQRSGRGATMRLCRDRRNAPPLAQSNDTQEFNSQIDNLVRLGVRVTACVGLAQRFGSEEGFRRRGIALESAAAAFPRFAVEGATVVSF